MKKVCEFMKKMVIEGGQELTGIIKISGAKNSAVALIPAAILSDSEVIIDNVPNISDTDALIEILKLLKCEIDYQDNRITIDTTKMENILIPEEYANKLRASYYFMGALLGKYKKVEIYFPGGCNIGKRPINLHLKGFEALGAKVEIDGNKYTIIADELKGNNIYLDFASCGATVNLMLAAVKAQGVTKIKNAAKEPEIVNLATLLNNMGAKIYGAGTSEITIYGVEKLGKARVEVIPDRIEAGTYMIIGALLGRNLVISDIIKEHNEALYSKLKDMGVDIQITDNCAIINKSENLKPVNIKSLVFPGFVTDLGQPMQVLLTQAEGESSFEETIFENRIGHIPYLQKMGADIILNGQIVNIKGKSYLTGTSVEATDLRAGAAMVIAGLIANGTTEISKIEHILRGYDGIVEKLNNVGANIKIVEE